MGFYRICSKTCLPSLPLAALVFLVLRASWTFAPSPRVHFAPLRVLKLSHTHSGSTAFRRLRLLSLSLSDSLPLSLSFIPSFRAPPVDLLSELHRFFFVVLDLRYVRRSALHTTTGTAERRAARFLCARVRDSSYKCKEKRKERGGQKVGAWCACTAVRGRFSLQATHFVGRRRP